MVYINILYLFDFGFLLFYYYAWRFLYRFCFYKNNHWIDKKISCIRKDYLVVLFSQPH